MNRFAGPIRLSILSTLSRLVGLSIAAIGMPAPAADPALAAAVGVADAVPLAAALVPMQPEYPLHPQSPLGTLTVYWDNQPIPLTLAVGSERRITFPARVRVGVDAATAERVRVQSVDRTVHLLARAPVDPVRIQVREVETDWMYLIDLSAVAEGGDIAPVEIVDLARRGQSVAGPLPVSGRPGQRGGTGATGGASQATPSTASVPPPALPTQPQTAPSGPQSGQVPPWATSQGHDVADLVRFALQQLHAPERLLSRLALPGVNRIPVPTRAVDYLYRGGAFEARPTVGWTDGRNYITAVRLKNRTGQPRVVDPRAIRGRWSARGLFAAEVRPTGDAQGRDQTTVVLISPVPFAEAAR